MNIEEVKEEALTPPPAAVKAAQASAPTGQPQPEAKNEAQQKLEALEKAYNESLQACAQTDDEHEKLLARRFEAEKKKFQALAALTTFKEQLLINAVNNLQQQAAQQKKQ